ncbi:MAG: N-acetyl-gamma-glutamyl-phosphate reductase [Porticoccaceae bacterium]|nr:N-acetyl-gamma-glutamyl-phosphate reductase [Porticoccaceae bacterium]MDG1474431.1 N-acetyl-gamma-glutamyl-phosphate reductase [Porticoccaceae bacterium]
MKKTKVSIIGGSGYLAAELLRNLIGREDVDILRVSSKDHIGKNIGQVNRSFWGLSDIVLEDISPTECAAGADIVFLAMPHVITARVAMELFALDVRIIDLSGDFRLDQLSDYTRYYADQHPCPERLGTFIYGMPELYAEQIKTAKHVANPGCFATCIATALLPLASANHLRQTAINVVALTGSSGSGVHPQMGNHHAVRTNNLKAYKVFNHQHTPEVLQTLAAAGATDIQFDFVPVSAPLSRGMMSIAQFDVPNGLEEHELREIYHAFYKEFPLISILPKGMAPEVAAIKNSARIEIGIDVSEAHANGTKTLCVTSVLDNLIKGGAGQAMQNFNLMTGHENNYLLDSLGMWP